MKKYISDELTSSQEAFPVNPSPALESAKEAVENALAHKDNIAQAERIRTHFTFEKRAERLLELVK